MEDGYYNGNRDENFVNLTFIYQKINLRLETYKLEKKQSETNASIDKVIADAEKMRKDIQGLITTIISIILTISIIPTAITGIQYIDSNYVLPFLSSIILFGMIMIIFIYNIYQDKIKISTWIILITMLILSIGFWVVSYKTNIANDLRNDNITNNMQQQIINFG